MVTKRAPSRQEIVDLLFAWKVCKHVKSNAIVFARDGRTIGIGAGQMSRVDSVRIAVMKAQSELRGCAVASDAYFPFADGLIEAADAGATCVIQPGGSVRDPEVIAAADERGIWRWRLPECGIFGTKIGNRETGGWPGASKNRERS